MLREEELINLRLFVAERAFARCASLSLSAVGGAREANLTACMFPRR
jgi:hypothetical protein